MKFSSVTLLSLLVSAPLLVQAQRVVYGLEAQQLPLYLDESANIDARVKDALSRMTLAEKCRLSYAQSKFSSPGVPRLGIPDMWYSDGPHGVRAEINWNDWGYSGWTNDSITAYPALTALASTWNTDLALQYGLSVGQEARFRHKTVLLGPGCNIYRTPLNGRNFEYLGEDPYLASRMVVPYIKGVQQNGVGACIKHFILNDQEEYRGHVDVKVSDRAFYEIYLPPFKAAVQEADVWAVMGSYNQYHNQHVSHNQVLLNWRLKGELGFKGLVVSDWGATHDTYEAAFYGLDSEMGSYTNGLTTEGQGFGYDDYYLGRAYYDMCINGEVPDSIIDDKAGRVLRVLFQSMKSNYQPAPNGRIGSPEQIAAARQIADEGIILLKNSQVNAQGLKGSNAKLLPITPGRFKRILVVGENATRSLCMGGGSSELKTKFEISPLQGIRDRFGADAIIDYAEGYRSGPSMYGRIEQIPYEVMDSLRHDAVDRARQADLVIYVGGLNKNHFSDCEGGDRLTYDLDYRQNTLIDALLSANPRMVCVIISGNAFRMPWLSRVPALVHTSYLGSVAGAAIADVLSGDVNPSGKTCYSYPASISDCPAHMLGRISYPGIEPENYPHDLAVTAGRNPSSANLLAVAAKTNGLRDRANQLTPAQRRPTYSDNPADHAGRGDETELYAEDILVGYRWYDYHNQNAVEGKAVTFPFGYGLSYTQFKYGQPTIFGNTVSVTVQNVGKVAGKETVQFYIGDDKSTVVRPKKELKYFAKVDLQPGELKTISYNISDDDLKYFDEKKHRWVLESGDFTVYVCSSSIDVKGKITITR